MRDAKIVTLYKTKGERSDCNNYRGISLLCIVGKVYARVLLVRLQKLAERVYPESQCGFRAGNQIKSNQIFIYEDHKVSIATLFFIQSSP